MASLMLVGAGISQEAAATPKPGTVAKPGPSAAVRAKRKSAPKLVDINSATKMELLKLPGISSEQADRIIAGRPFNSKFNLLTRSILPNNVFNGVRKRIEIR
ncbi:MAG: helix-hairpin-helix domain-containing protein [Holophaga sp.]|nr:helix-hairpin-helix domain-containing protein [Holophaga sp.]